MTLGTTRQVGQLVFTGFQGTSLPPSLRRAINAGRVGGVILFSRNIESPAQAAALTRELAGAAQPDLPLFIAIDQEGGRVQRIRATEWPAAETLGAGPLARTEEVAHAIGCEVAAIGCNVDFAPVLDVLVETRNPVMAGRCFSSDAETAAAHGAAFARGLRGAAVIPCAKHFPGHGRTTKDSHLALPEVGATLDELRAVDLAPFARAIAAGLDLVMTAHVRYTKIDPLAPATLSFTLLGELLRGEMGFGGVVVSDDLEMKAISDLQPVGEAAAAAITAGCDMALVCSHEDRAEEVFAALSRLQESDPFLQRRIAVSAARVAGLKRRRLSSWRPPDPHAATRIVGSEAHRKLAAGT